LRPPRFTLFPYTTLFRSGVFDREQVRQTFDRDRDARWLWAVACETSTGILNDVDWLKELCAGRGVKLCLDCISAIGTVPVDLQRSEEHTSELQSRVDLVC